MKVSVSVVPFSTDDRTRVIFPLVKTFCEKCFKADEAVLASLSFQYGKLCHGLSGERPDRDRTCAAQTGR